MGRTFKMKIIAKWNFFRMVSTRFYKDFETDLKTTYYAQFESTARLGMVEHIGLRKNGWNDWKVKEIIVDDETHEHGHLFEINQWIEEDEYYFFESVASTHQINDPAE